MKPETTPDEPSSAPLPDDSTDTAEPADDKPAPREIGGPKGPEPTRYGDWERKGRCI
ncbi:MAG: DUF1674 domain-containing protein, partial [Gammaproteobacteria bacterium]